MKDYRYNVILADPPWPYENTITREHSRKPDKLYEIIESCFDPPYLELFARRGRDGWDYWGDGALSDPRIGEILLGGGS
jgi:N6-adenosine-specific RNA methylase IME4